MNRFFAFIRDSAWTWCGAAIVLITLSGNAQKFGLWVTGGAFVGHFIAWAIAGDE